MLQVAATRACAVNMDGETDLRFSRLQVSSCDVTSDVRRSAVDVQLADEERFLVVSSDGVRVGRRVAGGRRSSACAKRSVNGHIL